MIRILHVIRAMDRAGAETFIMNVYRRIDREKYQFDFLVNVDSESDYDDEIRDLGGRIYSVNRYNMLNYFSYKKSIDRFLREHQEHQIVHGHIGSSASVYLTEAKKMGRYAIAHSHNTVPNSSAENVLFNIVTKKVRGKADYYFACSEEAGISRFGKDICNSEKFAIVKNGIDLEKYSRDNRNSLETRAELSFKLNTPIFCHIGRFDIQKNHLFLIDVFEQIKTQMGGAQLLLIGRGEGQEAIHRKVVEKGLTDSVHFLGVRDDIPNILRASDVFLFPSLWEGLGIAFVEAQAVGLPCIGSTGISKEAFITDRTMCLSLQSISSWAETAIAMYHKWSNNRTDCIEQVRNAGFDIVGTVNQLTEFYSNVDL